MNEYPEFDVVEITRKIGVNMLNSAEITSQEAAWYLLREPMSKCSTVVTSIPTMWPCDRQRIRKTQKELDAIGVGEDSTNIWKENWFDKYERRHEDLENITLAQFVANYTVKADDGLANGAVGKLVHLEFNDEGDVNVVWLDFPDSQKIGQKIKKKVAGHVASHQISTIAVPIGRRSATIPHNNNKTINVKRSHLPLVCACETTIHKSQGSTYAEIVYEYDKTHQLSLVYVALTRVTGLQGWYITTKDNDKTFYHGRRASTAINSLQEEFRRLSLNRLQTTTNDLLDFINQRRGLAMYTFNCQSLRAHPIDLIDPIMQKSNVLLLNETWLANEESISIPNFNCIIQYKRSNVRAGGVAIYQNMHDTINIITQTLI
ncbi:hypothetical protein EVAR_57463_1 [Eumeta japonica]|uniref:DNA helicase n=1 Tax=Eumeta variegata TaxID=151549 RepID=A0A4C1ZH95_EUMVA|nr:hypothetical protein EVAR_57463_1 [Eumeta japonica]